MKKVLIVGPSIKLKGGVATVIKNYREGLLNKNIDTKYLETIFTNKNYINIIFFPFIIIKYLIMIMDREIVHIHMASYGSFMRKSILIYIADFFNKNIVIHVHGAEFHIFYERSNEKYKKYISRTLDKAILIIALSDEWKIRLSKITNTSIEVMYNSVNVPEKNIYTGKGNNITFIGRMDERKGVYDLLDVAKKIGKLHSNIKILLCGDGDIEKIKRIVKSNKINNVEVLGWINKQKKEEILKTTIINILPSYNEGMPMSILEAMSFGIPTIATNVGGIPEVIVNNENGFLIIPGDKESMFREIDKLITETDVRKRISRKSYETVNEKFNFSIQIENLIKLYKEIT